MAVEIRDLDAHENADPDAERFPALVSGRLLDATRERQMVAAAVNGRVAAITRTYGPVEQSRFYALLAPRYFRDGGGVDIDFFVVNGEGELAPLQEV